MYDHRLYSNGMDGVLHVDWTLRCETPLVIRNGITISYNEQRQPKTRGQDIDMLWNHDGAFEVAALHYGYEITNGHVLAYHVVPPSSIRGALRSWTIAHLIDVSYRSAFMPPSADNQAETDAYLNRMDQGLADSSTGYPLIASLFGLAFETGETRAPRSNAGRLCIETERFQHATPAPIQANGTVRSGMAGPRNARRHLTVRNPLDRMTQASKDGGLHRSLEFCRGEEFAVHVVIRNPQASDLGVLHLWQREMNDGLLRIGALSSTGRGRVSIHDPRYVLWLRPGVPVLPHFESLKLDSTTDEALQGVWFPHELPPENLGMFEPALRAYLGGRYAAQP